MAMPGQAAAVGRRPIPNLRWWIGGLLFASTVINYLDRQTLSLLAPFLKQEYHWSNTDYANLLIGFRVAYSIGQTVFGRVMDKVGTRRGLTMTVLGYSVISMCTAMASGFRSFATFRFLLGAGESANWPAATKAVSEWFPKRERGLATALFDSGSSIGGALSLSGFVDLLPVGVASCFYRPRGPGVGMAGDLAHGLPLAGRASTSLRGRTRNDPGRPK